MIVNLDNPMTDDIFMVSFEAVKHPPRKYTKLTPSAIRVMEYYAALCQSLKINRFRRSLKTIAREVFGNEMKARSVSRGNDCLQQLGLLTWESGGGNGPGAACFPNVYTVNPSVFGLPGWEQNEGAGRRDDTTT